MGSRNNIGLMIMVAIGWWGLMFPEYGLGNSVTVRMYEEDLTRQEQVLLLEEGDTELLYHLLEAEPEDIVIKSKLYETIKAVLNKS